MDYIFQKKLIIQTHIDYRGLEKAKIGLEAVNKYSNELIKEDEDLSIIQKCQVSLTCSILIESID